jgi:hypothetical protein
MCSGWACNIDTVVGSSNQAQLSTVSWQLQWVAPIKSAGEIIEEKRLTQP